MAKRAVAVRKRKEDLSEFELTNALFAPLPILEGEDTDAYKEFYRRVWDVMAPKDTIEAMYVRDYVRLTWEILRNCSQKDRLIKAQVPKALEEALEPIVNGLVEEQGSDLAKIEVKVGLKPTPTERIVREGWCRGKSDTIEWIKTALGEVGLTMADIEARAMALALDEIVIIDRMTAQAESRRYAILHQHEDWHGGFGQRLRQAARAVIDGEFNAVESETKPEQSGILDDQRTEDSGEPGE